MVVSQPRGAWQFGMVKENHLHVHVHVQKIRSCCEILLVKLHQQEQFYNIL